MNSLGLDPSDPLNLLLHNHQDPTQQLDGSIQPDWAQLSASLWASAAHAVQEEHGKPASLFDFSSPLDFDMTFDPAMAVDPSALQLNAYASYASATPHTPLDGLLGQHSFPFTPSPGAPLDAPPIGRRLSITSSASSSGASLSPVLDNASIGSSSASSHNGDSADDLAARVAQLAGVLSAIPGGSAAAQFILGGKPVRG